MKTLYAIAVSVTVVSLALWVLTGRNWYTKYEFKQEQTIEKTGSAAEEDPLAGTGFYNVNPEGKEFERVTVTHKVFQFGIFPTPQGLFDKHAISVTSFVLPAWALTGLAWFIHRKRGHAEKVQMERSLS